MRRLIVVRGLPLALLLMALAVVLMLSGASAVGFALGLVVAGTAGILLVFMLIYDVANGQNSERSRRSRFRGRRPIRGY